MKKSIRKFLLINLLLAISITTTLTAIGNYYLDQKDIEAHLDALMAVSALSYDALLGDYPTKRNLHAIQTSLHRISNDTHHFSFQVWSQQGKALLHAPNAPILYPDQLKDGFSTVCVKNNRWRVFSTTNLNSGARLILTDHYATRNELRRQIAQDDLYIMLLTFPLSGLFIWIIIGRGLASLDSVAKEVSHRAPSHLEPVNLQSLP